MFGFRKPSAVGAVSYCFKGRARDEYGVLADLLMKLTQRLTSYFVWAEGEGGGGALVVLSLGNSKHNCEQLLMPGHACVCPRTLPGKQAHHFALTETPPGKKATQRFTERDRTGDLSHPNMCVY